MSRIVLTTILLLVGVAMGAVIELESSPELESVADRAIGQLTPEVEETLRKYRAIIFIGQLGTKRFYFDSVVLSQTNARTSCTNMGMTLAEFANQAEIDFVAQRTPADRCWTGASVVNSATSYRWLGNGEYLADGISFESGTLTGLVINEYSSSYGRLHPYSSSDTKCYFCHQRAI
ncbi:uncharacterized protein LOC110842230 [Folsomia candida]|uniref:Killer cell lectin-like receptor 4 n=1 Tax=Folsomia candida TaxID=158441 RepID=A0A226EZZ7_FOLCA|nr:uncharacterized protein LOC110842230 [Folsomia candida]OXA63139.1 Killer cell lectin-like receptor 4 [Folsomia candida]